MLKEILSISGRPGLFKLLSAGKNNFVVESLVDKRRMPVHTSDRVVSLKEISIYTSEGDLLLGDLLDLIYSQNEGKEVDLSTFGKEKQSYFDYFSEVLPSFDRERVHANEIKKILTWYNILVASGLNKFANKEEEKTEEPKDENSSTDDK